MIYATDIPDEIWKPIKDYPDYEVSSLGRARSYRKERCSVRQSYTTIMNGGLSSNGYRKISIRNKDGMKSVWLHRIILLTFTEEPLDKKYEAGHIDGDHTNNCLTNLKWMTKAENEACKLLHGTHNRGEKCGTSKLSNDQAKDIINLYSSKLYTQERLAQIYNVSSATISRIVNGVRFI